MIKSTRIVVRPSTEIPFYKADESFTEYFKNTYQETGLVTLVGVSLSEDGLTKTYINVYASQEAHDMVGNDNFVIDNYTSKFKRYNSENGITVNVLLEEIEQN